MSPGLAIKPEARRKAAEATGKVARKVSNSDALTRCSGKETGSEAGFGSAMGFSDYRFTKK
jgi:hypothetical protein